VLGLYDVFLNGEALTFVTDFFYKDKKKKKIFLNIINNNILKHYVHFNKKK
jgi:hypothetical protein